MSIVTCEKCGNKYSDTRKTCPYCETNHNLKNKNDLLKEMSTNEETANPLALLSEFSERNIKTDNIIRLTSEIITIIYFICALSVCGLVIYSYVSALIKNDSFENILFATVYLIVELSSIIAAYFVIEIILGFFYDVRHIRMSAEKDKEIKNYSKKNN
ncbi:MAG: hypothetical protein SPL13_00850 [Clostridia bacterium]|nr:hypothetical protein [Clostridia bacterium]